MRAEGGTTIVSDTERAGGATADAEASARSDAMTGGASSARGGGRTGDGTGGGTRGRAGDAPGGASGAVFAQLYPCERCPLNAHDGFITHDADETQVLSTFKRGELQVDPNSTFLVEGTNSPHLYTVLSGWGFRYKMLEDGRRQIMNFIMPGDFLGLQSSLFGEMQHSVQSLSRMLLCVFERNALHKLFESRAQLSYDITWIAAREEQILEEHMLSIGRRSALERSAYLIAFVHARGRRTGLIEEGGPIAPFTQTHVADTLGLSLVHTNKTLRKLQDTRAIRWSGKSCYVNDEAALREMASWQGLPKLDRPFI